MNKVNKSKLRFYIVAFVLSCLFILIYCTTGLYGVSGCSMQPTLNDSDLLIGAKSFTLNYGDIIVIYSDDLEEEIIKRVIGLPGDKIAINHSGLYRNGELLSEDYVSTTDWYEESSNINTTVPDEYVFVLGDNRESSLDSRNLGNIPVDSIIAVTKFNITANTAVTVKTFKLALLAGLVCMIAVFLYRSFKLMHLMQLKAAKAQDRKEHKRQQTLSTEAAKVNFNCDEKTVGMYWNTDYKQPVTNVKKVSKE